MTQLKALGLMGLQPDDLSCLSALRQLTSLTVGNAAAAAAAAGGPVCSAIASAGAPKLYVWHAGNRV
jgi:hypothetical protein